MAITKITEASLPSENKMERKHILFSQTLR